MMGSPSHAQGGLPYRAAYWRHRVFHETPGAELSGLEDTQGGLPYRAAYWKRPVRHVTPGAPPSDLEDTQGGLL
jgi:hypothetical protein